MVPDPLLQILLNFSLGAAVSVYGTLVGAGGGFLLIPVFLLLHKIPHAQAVGTSLTIVAVNALSGTIGYLRDRKIDYRAGFSFALATIPGAVLGAFATSLVSGPVFQKAFGLVLGAAALFLLFRKRRNPHDAAPPPRQGRGWVLRSLQTRQGNFTYSYLEPLGIFCSLLVGAFSSLFGLGGGIIHVPLMTELLGFPVAVATATSQFILTWTAFTGALAHLSQGNLNFSVAVPAALGAVVGAQVGVRLARRVQGGLVMKALALGLLIVGARLLVK